MAFTSFRFIVFLVLAAAAYFLTPKRCRWVTLFVANYVFYFISGGRIFIYLLATTVTTYLATVKIGDMAAKNKIAFNEAKAELDKEGKKAWKAAFAKKKKRILIPTLLFNFGILAVLKYSGFVTENLNLLFAKIGIGTELPVFRFLLPLGISFYTFQSMGYLIDVYREKQEPERNFCKLALFISFFPQIVQGPISRFGTLAEQLFRANEFSYTRIKFGVQLMLWGAFKKMVIADRAAVLVDNAFGFPETFGGTYVAAAALAYAIQIYGDFSGGIDIATGAAQIFGVTLDKNFERPYLATSIPDYWRRWHMTLGGWFRDYLYIPLGGNRVSVLRWCFNMFVVWLLSGLWHGAGWNFALWGLYFGVFLSAEKLIGKKWKERSFKIADISANNDSNGGDRENMFLTCVRNIIEHGYVLLVVLFSFVIFRVEGVREIKEQFLGLSGCYGNAMTPMAAYEIKSCLILLLIACAGATPFPAMWVQRLKNASMWKKSGWLLQSCYILTGLVLATAFLLGSSVHPFLYFRF